MLHMTRHQLELPPQLPLNVHAPRKRPGTMSSLTVRHRRMIAHIAPVLLAIGDGGARSRDASRAAISGDLPTGEHATPSSSNAGPIA
jgi:hypothetical protein